MVSSVCDCSVAPVREIRPSVGFNACTPQNEPGRITDPPVCVPSASGIVFAPTAAAEPDDEPPGVCSGLCGLRVLFGLTLASSVVTVLPITMPPAALIWATHEASVSGWYPLKIGDPFWVGKSAVLMMSLMPTGRPCSAPTP